MTIVCGTDFSENATQAELVAAAIAERLGTPLELVHALEPAADLDATVRDAATNLSLRRLGERRELLSKGRALDARTRAVAGSPDEVLLDVAREVGAELIVVSSLGLRKQHRWLLGSVAERVAQSSPIPVLVVRHAESLEAWARGAKPLRVMVGIESTSVSKAALRWVVALGAIGPCEIVVTHVAWPPGEHERLGTHGHMPLDHLRPEVREALVRDLRSFIAGVPGAENLTLQVSPGLGRTDAHLALLAEQARVDLLVVGTHQRALAARFWQGSVSRGVLHRATSNVACVPRSGSEQESIQTFRRVLVPTDFSSLSDRAIPVAYGLVAPGGTVHLLHVVSRKPGEEAVDPAARLRALIPPGAITRGISTEIEVVTEPHASTAIRHAAERLSVDAICMATHGRSGALHAMLGSEAQAVVQHARHPVILVPPERST